MTPADPLPPEWRNDPFVRFFMRHVVPIYFQLRKGHEQRGVLFTAFLFSVHDNWLLMTAGHCNNACLQDAKIGMLEHQSDRSLDWFSNALAKCAKQYRIERENGR